MNSLTRTCAPYIAPAGRVLVGAYFLLAGVQKLGDIANVTAFIGTTALPASPLLAYAAAFFLIGAGGALLIGYQKACTAKLLALYVVLVTLLFHGPQMWPAEQGAFLKNLALLGGLLYIAGSCIHCGDKTSEK